MCTSVPQTPARRTRMRTSSSRGSGAGTSASTMPGPGDFLSSAFTCACVRRAFAPQHKHCDTNSGFLYSRGLHVLHHSPTHRGVGRVHHFRDGVLCMPAKKKTAKRRTAKKTTTKRRKTTTKRKRK